MPTMGELCPELLKIRLSMDEPEEEETSEKTE